MTPANILRSAALWVATVFTTVTLAVILVGSQEKPLLRLLLPDVPMVYSPAGKGCYFGFHQPPGHNGSMDSSSFVVDTAGSRMTVCSTIFECQDVTINGIATLREAVVGDHHVLVLLSNGSLQYADIASMCRLESAFAELADLPAVPTPTGDEQRGVVIAVDDRSDISVVCTYSAYPDACIAYAPQRTPSPLAAVTSKTIVVCDVAVHAGFIGITTVEDAGEGRSPKLMLTVEHIGDGRDMRVELRSIEDITPHVGATHDSLRPSCPSAARITVQLPRPSYQEWRVGDSPLSEPPFVVVDEVYRFISHRRGILRDTADFTHVSSGA